jgi:hypothetical protein
MDFFHTTQQLFIPNNTQFIKETASWIDLVLATTLQDRRCSEQSNSEIRGLCLRFEYCNPRENLNHFLNTKQRSKMEFIHGRGKMASYYNPIL